MPINTIFNETELTIFYRQTGFTFGESFTSKDGTIYALDRNSGQIFIGKDLLKSCLHALDTVVSAAVEDGSVLQLTFSDSSSVRIDAGEAAAEAMAAELRGLVPSAIAVPAQVEEEPAPDDAVAEDDRAISEEELNEVCSRLVNTGRKEAIEYLVKESGMSVKAAAECVDGLDGGEEAVEGTGQPVVPYREFYRDGTMTGNAIMAVVRNLEPGDRIHLEYKPLIGKLRVYDAEFRRLEIDVSESRYFTLRASGDNYRALMEDTVVGLFDHVRLYFFCHEDCSENFCRLKRVTILKKTD